MVLPDSSVVVGTWFRDGGDDTGGSTEGRASTDVELALEQEGQVWSLGAADAEGRDSHWSITVVDRSRRLRSASGSRRATRELSRGSTD